MDKLELKHLAGYLPYSLSIMYGHYKYPIFDRKEVLNLENIKHISSLTANIIKPILHPLSDLTKEIEFKYEDNNGILNTYPKKISVMEYLNIAKYNPHKYRPRLNRFEYSLGNGTVSYNFDVNGQLLMPYDIVKLFYINHFDIHGLIEKGLAIDINTLNKINK